MKLFSTRSLLACAVAGAALGCGNAPGNTAAEQIGSSAAADTAAENVAFARVYQNALYGPSVEGMSWSRPSTGAVTVTSPAVGTYLVNFPGITNAFGNVQVTPNYTNYRCAIGEWYSTGSALDVLVRCTTPSGTPANLPTNTNTYLDVVYTSVTSAQYWPIAYFTSPRTRPERSSPGYSGNTSEDGGESVVTHLGTGRYYVETTLFLNPTQYQVTAYGNTQGGYCTVAPVVDDAYVYCFNAAGAPADQQFSFLTYEVAPILIKRSGSGWVYTSGAGSSSLWAQSEYSSAAIINSAGSSENATASFGPDVTTVNSLPRPFCRPLALAARRPLWSPRHPATALIATPPIGPRFASSAPPPRHPRLPLARSATRRTARRSPPRVISSCPT